MAAQFAAALLLSVIASHRVRAKRGPMTGSAKAIQNLSAAADWIASLRSQ
jgi:hypothetical protein